MKKLFCIALCIFLLTSCIKKPLDTSSDTSIKETSSVSSVVEEIPSTADTSIEVSEETSSKEEMFEFLIDAKTAAKRILEELPFTADTVELDRHFISEKTDISEDMYEDFYGEASYETNDDSFIAVFCCKTEEKSQKLKQKLHEALVDEGKLSYLSTYAKVFSANGYVVILVTQNNFDEENLVSKLIQ